MTSEKTTRAAVLRAGVEGLDKPKLTPRHPTKKAVVVTVVDGKPKTIRFGDQSMGHNYSPEARKSFKARHAKNIAKGKASAAYWADKFLWTPGGSVKQPPKKRNTMRNFKEQIPGGLAAGRKPSDFDSRQLLRGMKVELEHVVRKGRKPSKKEESLAMEIAMDHLTESPNYYEMLEKAEKSMSENYFTGFVTNGKPKVRGTVRTGVSKAKRAAKGKPSADTAKTPHEQMVLPLEVKATLYLDFGDPTHFELQKGDIPLHVIERWLKRSFGTVKIEPAGGSHGKAKFAVTFESKWGPDKGQQVTETLEAELRGATRNPRRATRRKTKIPTPHKGSLGGPGYTDKAMSVRHRLLKEHIKDFGVASTVSALQSRINLGKSTMGPKALRVFEKDKAWVQKDTERNPKSSIVLNEYALDVLPAYAKGNADVAKLLSAGSGGRPVSEKLVEAAIENLLVERRGARDHSAVEEFDEVIDHLQELLDASVTKRNPKPNRKSPRNPKSSKTMTKKNPRGLGQSFPANFTARDGKILDASQDIKMAASVLSGTGGRVEVTPGHVKQALGELEGAAKKIKGLRGAGVDRLREDIKFYRGKAKEISKKLAKPAKKKTRNAGVASTRNVKEFRYPFSFSFLRSEQPPGRGWRDMNGVVGGDLGGLHDVEVQWDRSRDGNYIVYVDGVLSVGEANLDPQNVLKYATDIFYEAHRSLYPRVDLSHFQDLTRNGGTRNPRKKMTKRKTTKRKTTKRKTTKRKTTKRKGTKRKVAKRRNPSTTKRRNSGRNYAGSEWVEFVLDGMEESEGGLASSFTDELLEAQAEYESAVDESLEKCAKTFHATSEGFMEDDGRYWNVWATYEGEGVGIWDGRWDEYFPQIARGDIREWDKLKDCIYTKKVTSAHEKLSDAMYNAIEYPDGDVERNPRRKKMTKRKTTKRKTTKRKVSKRRNAGVASTRNGRSAFDNMVWSSDLLVRDIHSAITSSEDDDTYEGVAEEIMNMVHDDRSIEEPKANKYLTEDQAVEASILASKIIDWANYYNAYGHDEDNPPWEKTKRNAGVASTRNWPKAAGADNTAADELYLYMSNTRGIFDYHKPDGALARQLKSIIENLVKRKKKGTYDKTKAPKLFKYWVDGGAKEYGREFGDRNWATTFSVATRMVVARQFADWFEEAYAHGEFGDLTRNPGRKKTTKRAPKRKVTKKKTTKRKVAKKKATKRKVTKKPTTASRKKAAKKGAKTRARVKKAAKQMGKALHGKSYAERTKKKAASTLAKRMHRSQGHTVRNWNNLNADLD